RNTQKSLWQMDVDLYLGYSKIDDSNLKQISNFKNIKSLTVNGSSISDESIETFIKIPHLEYLDITNTKITDDGIRYITSNFSDQLTLHHIDF
ncbi:MAG: hypothetical protein ACPG5P_05550, partial [Saprospiraceae bacterium]